MRTVISLLALIFLSQSAIAANAAGVCHKPSFYVDAIKKLYPSVEWHKLNRRQQKLILDNVEVPEGANIAGLLTSSETDRAVIIIAHNGCVIGRVVASKEGRDQILQLGNRPA